MPQAHVGFFGASLLVPRPRPGRVLPSAVRLVDIRKPGERGRVPRVQLEDALALLDAALQRQPTNPAALRAKGAALEEQGAFEEALRVYEVLHEASPREAETWALQASMLVKLMKNEEALAAYREAILLDPENAEYQAKVRELESSRGSQGEFLEELFTIKGMGAARVRSLIEAGYRTPDSIRNATEDELANVGGMTRAVAKDLRRHFSPELPPA